jgi:hypothetical protein
MHTLHEFQREIIDSSMEQMYVYRVSPLRARLVTVLTGRYVKPRVCIPNRLFQYFTPIAEQHTTQLQKKKKVHSMESLFVGC